MCTAKAEFEVLEEQAAAVSNDHGSRTGHAITVGDEQLPRSAGARAAAPWPDVSRRSLQPYAAQCDCCLHAELLQQATTAPAAEPELDRRPRVPVRWQPVLQGARLPATAHCLKTVEPCTRVAARNISICKLEKEASELHGESCCACLGHCS